MKSNMGAFDGAFRTLLFVLAICYAILGGTWLWIIPTSILFASTLLSWCPIYAITGIDTHKDGAEAH
jgi:Protein of unknown function (DUF2892)